MKLALLGKGKTGKQVLDIYEGSITVFDQKNPPLPNALHGHDVILSFLPGNIFHDLIPMLLNVNIPVVNASTGFIWPENIDSELLKKKIPWIHGSNFASVMQLAFYLVQKWIHSPLPSHGKFLIHETHHKDKKDTPSGTALVWKDLLNEWGKDISIESTRLNNVAGIHEMTFKTEYETLSLKHKVQNRKAFAEGAILACHKVRELPPGLHLFHKIFLKDIQ